MISTGLVIPLVRLCPITVAIKSHRSGLAIAEKCGGFEKPYGGLWVGSTEKKEKPPEAPTAWIADTRFSE
jgi:hypothetical protein